MGWGEIGRDHTTLVLHTNTLSLIHMPAERNALHRKLTYMYIVYIEALWIFFIKAYLTHPVRARVNKGGSSACAPGAPPVENSVRVYFLHFCLYMTHKLYCNQHAMCKMCILFSRLTTKA